MILDGGETLIDSAVIVDSLDEMQDQARALVPRHGEERRKVLQATALAEGIAEKAGQVVYERFFHPGASLNKKWEQRCLSQLASGLERLEGQCASPWYFGTRMSHADVMTACMVGYLNLRLTEGFPAGRYPRLHALALHCESQVEFIKSSIRLNESMPAAGT